MSIDTHGNHHRPAGMTGAGEFTAKRNTPPAEQLPDAAADGFSSPEEPSSKGEWKSTAAQAGDDAADRAGKLFAELRTGLAELGVDPVTAGDLMFNAERQLTVEAVMAATRAAEADAVRPPEQNDVYATMSGVWTSETPLDVVFTDLETFDAARGSAMRGDAGELDAILAGENGDHSEGLRQISALWASLPDDGSAAGAEAGPMAGMTRGSFDAQFDEIFAHFDAREQAERAL